MTRTNLACVSAITLACLATACGASAPEPQPSSQAAAAPAGAPATEELANATYSGLEDLAGPVTLKDGRWEGEPFEPGGVSRPSVSLAPGFRLTGDLDGNGSEDAVVVLAQSSGGSGTFNYLAAVTRQAAGLQNFATVALGDRVGIRSARIEAGTLHVSVVRAGENDAMCCPGELADLAWTLSGGKLEPVGSGAPAGRLTLDTLAGTEWVLRAWNIGEASPAQPEVTLAYKDGQLAGGSGCNRYSYSARPGGMPGDLSVGPGPATQMACPDAETAVEARYLKQLGGVKKFGFMLGQLALTYEGDGGVYGVMLFDRRPAARQP